LKTDPGGSLVKQENQMRFDPTPNENRLKRAAHAVMPYWRAVLLGLIAPLAACGPDRPLPIASVPTDYTARHPIILDTAPVGISIFASNGGIDSVTRAHLEAFAQASRQGASGIEILFPHGSINEAQQRHALPAIRGALAAAGAKGYLSVGVYPVIDASQAAPIRLSYRTLHARVANKCGEWPADLASGSTLDTWKNEPYWNMGCSYQQMYASQVSDPRDFLEPRATANGDVEMRIRAIGKVRAGSDPGTTWTTKNSSIGSVGN
jgi:pilus assembly protein CpaD